ncbi:hypothetical protein LBU54_01005 [Winogradskyella sp. D23]|uniref:Uncharacterized protein n=2 Tax=Winogradskyella alexanderae TaxID=2877123 RepID=A0ABS7XNR4_9FLAO|nr:hypothetical protein [Winogradskyella alexanderae]
MKEEFAVRDSVLNSLGLNNLNQLRDRYEGQTFLDKTLKKYGGLVACQKHLNIKVTSIDELNIKDFKPQIEGKKDIYDIKVFDFGALPALELSTIKNPLIFVIQKDKSTFSICGYGNRDLVLDNLVDSNNETVNSVSLKNFIGFSDLKPIEEILK